jgi:hypothetical protein
LRQEQKEVVAAGDPREVNVDQELSVAVDVAAGRVMADSNEFVRQSAQFHFLERARLDADSARGDGRTFHLIDDSDRNAEAAQFQRGGQAGGPAPGDQDRLTRINGHGDAPPYRRRLQAA